MSTSVYCLKTLKSKDDWLTDWQGHLLSCPGQLKSQDKIKFQHLHKHYAIFLYHIFIYNHFTKKQIFTILFGIRHFIRHLLCSKWLWLFFFKNLLFWWQALDGVLVEPPEMGLLGNSGKKVTNDCIALIHLHIQPIYLSNIFVLLRGIFTPIRYICREMLYRF